MARSKRNTKTMAGNKVTGNESNKELLMILVADVRENRNEINSVKNHLMTGQGKISANREAIDTLKSDMRDTRTKSYVGSGGITIGIQAGIEILKRIFGG